MLAIRLQRTGRSGHSQFRLVAQDSRFSPKRGRIVAYLGSYDPHTKQAKLDTEKVSQYLSNGAQPSDSAAKLLQKEGVKLPGWVKTPQPKQRAVRNADKRRSTRPADAETPSDTPAEPQAAAPEAAPDAEAPAEEPAAEPQPAAEGDTGQPETPAKPDSPAETPQAAGQ